MVRLLAVGALLLCGLLLYGAAASGGPRLFAAFSDTCERRDRPVVVRMEPQRWPLVADHIADVRSRYPQVLHIDRFGASANRRESTAGVRTRKGFDRDEYPPAVAREGGRGADVRLVPSSENRSAGASLGRQLRRWCDGQAFRVSVRG